jgi:hypothetical protein
MQRLYLENMAYTKKVYCPFPSCFKEKEVKPNAKKAQKALQLSGLSRVNRQTILRPAPEG